MDNVSIDRRSLVISAAAAAAGIGLASVARADEASRGDWQPGTYTGTGAGYMGAEVSATVTLDEQGIVSVEFADSCAQTYGIGTKALDLMPQRIVEAQSLAVDTVSCATKTSKGVIAAVADALTQAGADIAAWSAPVAHEDLSEADAVQMSADVVVLGAGGAGMACALAALEQGKTVIVVEKSDICGGDTARSEGHLFCAMSEYQKSLGIEDDLETAANDYNYNARWMSRPELSSILINNCGPDFDWLIGASGMPLSDTLITEDYAGQSGILRAYEPSSGRASEFTVPMEESMRAYDGLTLILGTTGTQLMTQEGAVCGLKARDNRTGQRYELTGTRVVLASGAFPGTDAVMRAKWGVKECWRSSGSPVISGDGHKMALDLKAGTWRMNQVTVRIANAFEYVEGKACSVGKVMPLLQSGAGIIVGEEGRRLGCEFDGTNSILSNVGLAHALPGGCFYLVMDESTFKDNLYVAKGDLTDETSDWDAWLEQNNCKAGGIAHAATVKEAGDRAGIDGEALESAVRYYNYRLEVGADDEFGRVDAQPIDIEGGEVYVMRITQSYVCSSGGLWVNEKMQVCDESHTPIEGLYAAGNVAGGGMGEPYYMGGSVAWSIVTGRLCGTVE